MGQFGRPLPQNNHQQGHNKGFLRERRNSFPPENSPDHTEAEGEAEDGAKNRHPIHPSQTHAAGNNGSMSPRVTSGGGGGGKVGESTPFSPPPRFTPILRDKFDFLLNKRGSGLPINLSKPNSTPCKSMQNPDLARILFEERCKGVPKTPKTPKTPSTTNPTSPAHNSSSTESSRANRPSLRKGRGTASGAMPLKVAGVNGFGKVLTIWQNYYPEGGWGWIVLVTGFGVTTLTHGFQMSFTTLGLDMRTSRDHSPVLTGWLGSFSLGVSLFLSPIWVSLCKRKSTRLSAVFGGLIVSLGCLFTSFATQFHQLFFSYGLFMGVGVGLTRDSSALMVGQYFKRKRELVEVVVVSGSGLGILLMSIFIHSSVSAYGWRLGLQAVTCALVVTFFLGTAYRSASLYHPQRRAILHLKNQKRKFKEKEKREDKPPFLDLSCLRSKTLQILLLSTAFIAFGVYSPLFLLSVDFGLEIEPHPPFLLQVHLGSAWILGCVVSGLLATQQKGHECRISRQYLTQAEGLLCGVSILALVGVADFNGLVVFSWAYGFTLGGWNYALKVYLYERVRARHFPRAWSFVQAVQAFPLILGVPTCGHLNSSLGWNLGYYLASASVITGSLLLFLTDFRRRRLSRNKSQTSSLKTAETIESARSPNKARRFSFNNYPVNPNHHSGAEQASPLSESRHLTGRGSDHDSAAVFAKELTCVSEENIADLDFQDIYFEDFLEANCITSCNKVENCLASEYDPDCYDRRSRRSSAVKQLPPPTGHGGVGSLVGGVTGILMAQGPLRGIPERQGEFFGSGRGRLIPPRPMEVIDEASV